MGQDDITTVVAGDLFEREEDLEDDSIWMEAGSENEELQRLNRSRILSMANVIVPGHGRPFKVVKAGQNDS